jgi:hypothetical protein
MNDIQQVARRSRQPVDACDHQHVAGINHRPFQYDQDEEMQSGPSVLTIDGLTIWGIPVPQTAYVTDQPPAGAGPGGKEHIRLVPLKPSRSLPDGVDAGGRAFALLGQFWWLWPAQGRRRVQRKRDPVPQVVSSTVRSLIRGSVVRPVR